MDLWKNPKWLKVKTLNDGVRYVARTKSNPVGSKSRYYSAPLSKDRAPTSTLEKVHPCPLLAAIIRRDFNKGSTRTEEDRNFSYWIDKTGKYTGMLISSYVFTKEYWDSLLEIPELKSAQVYWEMTK